MYTFHCSECDICSHIQGGDRIINAGLPWIQTANQDILQAEIHVMY